MSGASPYTPAQEHDGSLAQSRVSVRSFINILTYYVYYILVIIAFRRPLVNVNLRKNSIDPLLFHISTLPY